MQKWSAFLFAMVFLFKPVMPVADYFINYDYIVAELCINKDNISKGCNGKCHLVNELADAAQNDDSNIPDRKLQFTTDVLFFIEPTVSQPNPCAVKTAITYTHRADRYHYLHAGAVYHPPIFG